MVKLNVVKGLDVSHELCYLTFKEVHVISKLVLLAQYLLSHVIQCVIVYFEDFFHAFLVAVHFLNHHLLFLDIWMLELDDILLDRVANVCQYSVFMAIVQGQT